MVTIRILIPYPAHLIHNLGLGGIRRQLRQLNLLLFLSLQLLVLLLDLLLLLLLLVELGRGCRGEVLTSQQQHLFVEAADHGDFGRLFFWGSRCCGWGRSRCGGDEGGGVG